MAVEARRSQRQHAPRTALIAYRLGLVDKPRADHEAALKHYESALSQLPEGVANGRRTLLLVEIGFARGRLGDIDGWEAACREALSLAKRVDHASEPHGEEAAIRLLHTLGGVYYPPGELTRAERFYRQAGRLAERLGEPRPAATACNNLAATLYRKGDVAEARDIFLRSLTLRERIGDLSALAVAYNNLAEVARGLGDSGAALDQFQHAAELAGGLRREGTLHRHAPPARRAAARAGRHGWSGEARRARLRHEPRRGRRGSSPQAR